MSRYADWPERLNDYLISVKDKKFEWGVFDCCIFAAGGLKAMTGEDFMEEFRGAYDSKDSSEKALEEIGSGNLVRTLIKKFGRPKRGMHGQRGDVAVHKEGQLGLILGRQAIFLVDEGFGLAPLSHVRFAFRVE